MPPTGCRGWPRSTTWATGAQVRDLCHPPGAGGGPGLRPGRQGHRSETCATHRVQGVAQVYDLGDRGTGRDLCHPPGAGGGPGLRPGRQGHRSRPVPPTGCRGWPRSTTWATGAQVRDLCHPPGAGGGPGLRPGRQGHRSETCATHRCGAKRAGVWGEAPPKEESPDASRAPGDDGVVKSVATVGGAKNPRRLWTEARCFGRPTRGLVANPPPFLKPAGHERTRGRLPQELAASVRTARPWLDRLQTAPPTERSDWPRRTPRG